MATPSIQVINPFAGFSAKMPLSGPSANVLNLTKEQIEHLPTITELVDFLHSLEQEEISCGYWDTLSDFPMPIELLRSMGMDNPYIAYTNDAQNDQFLLNRLGSQRYCLKPNLAERPFLYRGQSKMYPRIVSSFERPDENGLTSERKLVSNLKYADFLTLLKSHPLFRMFDNGINLDGFGETVFIEMNYYGLAQHYGFNTGLIDFSSDISVSAFFACTKYLGHDKYEVFMPADALSYGVVYVHHINPDTTFKGPFSSIGLQVFPRSGVQKGFFFQEVQNLIDVNEAVVAYPFRHEAVENQKIFDRWQGGALLFPDDELSSISQQILDSKDVSLRGFAYNLYVNPRDDMNANLEKCERYGINVNKNLHYVFTEALLDKYYRNICNGWWENFCNQINFSCNEEKAKKMKTSLLELPKNHNYEQFFNKDYYDRLYYHQRQDEHLAHRRLPKRL
jgi:hypothetical protein